MTHSRSRYRWFVPTVLAGAVAGLILIAGQPSAQGQMGGNAAGSAGQKADKGPSPEEADVVVGTYDPRAVFQQYPGSQDLMAMFQDAQRQMQQAQQSGDQQKMQQIQRDMQAKQQEAVQEFQAALDKTLPTVAESKNVHVVATQVVYTADDVAQTDLTNTLVQAMQSDSKGDSKGESKSKSE